MKVFTLPESQQENVLLMGDLDFVMEFAERLHAANIQFSIVGSAIDLDPLDFEMQGLDTEFEPTTADADDYGMFAPNVLADMREGSGLYSHIIDIGVDASPLHRSSLELAAMLNPKATVLCSVLTSTATEIGLLTGTEDRITGFTLAPYIISHASTIDFTGGLNTSKAHIDRSARLLTMLDYKPQLVEDRVGLVQMRILVMLINEAAFAVMEGVATPADIDTAMKLGVNYPIGLLAWADYLGIGVVAIILDSLNREYLQERYRPCVLLKQYVRAGWLGKRSGKGFYTYP